MTSETAMVRISRRIITLARLFLLLRLGGGMFRLFHALASDTRKPSIQRADRVSNCRGRSRLSFVGFLECHAERFERLFAAAADSTFWIRAPFCTIISKESIESLL